MGTLLEGRGGFAEEEDVGRSSSRSRSRLGRGGDRIREDVPSPFRRGERERDRRCGRSGRDGGWSAVCESSS